MAAAKMIHGPHCCHGSWNPCPPAIAAARKPPTHLKHKAVYPVATAATMANETGTKLTQAASSVRGCLLRFMPPPSEDTLRVRTALCITAGADADFGASFGVESAAPVGLAPSAGVLPVFMRASFKCPPSAARVGIAILVTTAKKNADKIKKSMLMKRSPRKAISRCRCSSCSLGRGELQTTIIVDKTKPVTAQARITPTVSFRKSLAKMVLITNVQEPNVASSSCGTMPIETMLIACADIYIEKPHIHLGSDQYDWYPPCLVL
mmetsp:Transcript_66621/g.124341  ORF Transcript_66621/g.124341 Transcript_66621/m.124341 type:complete len:264 (+) Transcript_66621:700-1491(+)